VLVAAGKTADPRVAASVRLDAVDVLENFWLVP
jgi:hypothetical protein